MFCLCLTIRLISGKVLNYYYQDRVNSDSLHSNDDCPYIVTFKYFLCNSNDVTPSLKLYSFNNHSLYESFSKRNSMSYDIVCLEEGLYSLELTGGFIDSTSLQGVTVTVNHTSIPIVSVPFLTSPRNISILLTDPFSSSWRFHLCQSIEEVLAFQYDSSITPSFWNVTDTLVFSDPIPGVVLQRTISIPSPRPSLLILQLRYQGGIEVYYNNEKVARFCETVGVVTCDNEIHTDFFSYPVAFLAGFESVTLSVKLFSPGNSSFDATAFFDYEKNAMVRESYSSTTLPSELHDYDVLTSFTSQHSSYFTVGFANRERIVASSMTAISMYGSTFSSGHSFLYKNSEFSTTFTNDTITLRNWTMVELFRFDGGTDVEEYAFYFDTSISGHNSNGPLFLTLTQVVPMYYHSDVICTPYEGYPQTTSGTAAAIPCGNDMWGVVYRECNNGTWGEPDRSHCFYHTPTIMYSSRYLVMYTSIPFSFEPKVTGKVDTFSLRCTERIDPCLHINETTGVISGNCSDTLFYTCIVAGGNTMVTGYTSIIIMVTTGKCSFNTDFYSFGNIISIPCGDGYSGIVEMICQPSTESETGGVFILHRNTCAIPVNVQVYQIVLFFCNIFLIACAIALLFPVLEKHKY